MIKEILLATAVMLVLGALFALLLSYLGNKLKIKRDDRIDEVLKLLSGANCGGCGYAGCDAFATAVVEGKAKISDCPVTAVDKKNAISEMLGGGDVGEETIAVVHCGGGNLCLDKYEYQGYGDCNTCEMLADGRKACPVGCMGLGSCVDSCPYYAVEVNSVGFAEVIKEKCVSCGNCIKECPKNLISRIPKSAAVFIGCSNHAKGKEVKSICKVGCIACGLCAKVCPTNAIEMVDDLPVIDYSKCIKCLKCAEKCPTSTIKKL